MTLGVKFGVSASIFCISKPASVAGVGELLGARCSAAGGKKPRADVLPPVGEAGPGCVGDAAPGVDRWSFSGTGTDFISLFVV